MVVARPTVKPRKAVGRVAAPKKTVQLLPDVPRERPLDRRERAPERGEALPHHRVEQVVGGTPKLDDAGHEPQRKARAVPTDIRRWPTPGARRASDLRRTGPRLPSCLDRQARRAPLDRS